MAVATSGPSVDGWAARRKARKANTLPVRHPGRVLVASASPIDPQDKTEARKQRVLRQGWQSNAWNYRDGIGEVRYAGRFMANCVSRMRIFPAAYPSNDFGEDPISLSEIKGVPPSVLASATSAMDDLATGRLAMAQIMENLGENLFIAGEAWILGLTDPMTGEEDWRIASVDEIIVKEDSYYLREVPLSGAFGDQANRLIGPNDFISRLWVPHPRYAAFADSALRALSEECEELLILGRMIRAAGRSRLAGAGILLVPDELDIVSTDEDDQDAEASDFIGDLTNAMMEPIAEEGSASAVVPIVIQGPSELLGQVRHMLIERTVDPVMAAQRDELISRIATGLDLPSEVLTGKADLNHWTAWNVDDNTFRHHVEPAVIACVDALTVGYLRRAMLSDGCPPEWVNKIVLWYDPTDLVVHPDRSTDALLLHERLVISDATLREATGYDDTDKPSDDELLLRMLRNERTFPPNIVEALFHQYAPGLNIPADPVLPGIAPSGIETPATAPVAAPAPVTPAPTTPPESIPKLPAVTAPTPPPALPASGAPTEYRLSRKLVDIDRDLRTRLQVLANTAVRARLSRAGARLRSKVVASKDETMKAKINHRPNERAMALVGPRGVAAVGLTASHLLAGGWDEIKPQFDAWVKSAQGAALATAVTLAGNTPKAQAAAAQVALGQSQAAKNAWTAFSAGLDQVTAGLSYDPAPGADDDAWGDLDPNALVPTGLVRSALAVAGGAALSSVMGNIGDRSADDTDQSGGDPIGQIGTGDDITGMLSDCGGDQGGYEWTSGPAAHDFQPHTDLDGVTFTNFDDDVLANNSDFPDCAYYTPGDHVGCSCDVMPLWSFSGNTDVPQYNDNDKSADATDGGTLDDTPFDDG